MKRLPLIWLAALSLGIASGLAFAWLLAPDSIPDTPPRALRADFKDRWREAIASSYAVTGDLPRARARLELMGDQDSIQVLGAQAQRALASGAPFEAAQELARLAADLQKGVSSVPSRPPVLSVPTTSSPATPAISPLGTAPSATALNSAGASPETQATANATPVPLPSLNPAASPTVPFRLVSRDEFCDPNSEAGQLMVTILDASGGPLPGIEISVTSNEGTDRFFTGLQPEIGPGYADYTMKGGTTYSVQVARLGVPVAGLTPPICSTPENKPYLGGVQLTFAAP